MAMPAVIPLDRWRLSGHLYLQQPSFRHLPPLHLGFRLCHQVTKIITKEVRGIIQDVAVLINIESFNF